MCNSTTSIMEMRMKINPWKAIKFIANFIADEIEAIFAITVIVVVCLGLGFAFFLAIEDKKERAPYREQAAEICWMKAEKGEISYEDFRYCKDHTADHLYWEDKQ